MHSSTPITYTTDREQLAALRVPFPITEIMKLPGKNKEMNYYRHCTIQDRLLNVLGSGFSIRIISSFTDKDTNTAHVEALLEVEWVSGRKSKISGLGTHAIQTSGDHFKACYSEALKICASKLGCGLELYDDRYNEKIDQ